MAGSDPKDLAAVASGWFAAHPSAASGSAVVCFRAGAAVPVGVATRAFASAPAPHSLDVILYDPSATAPEFLLVVGLAGDYIGPGEYKGGPSDVMVGLGVVDGDSAETWTAGAPTASDLIAYASGPTAAAATLTTSGLVTGPIFGPPTGNQPACAVLFAWFELEDS